MAFDNFEISLFLPGKRLEGLLVDIDWFALVANQMRGTKSSI